MNVLLKKSFLILSLLSFFITAGLSLNAGNSLVSCLFRGCIALVVIGIVGSCLLKSVFRDIALELLEFEEKRKDEAKEKMREEAESVSERLAQEEMDTFAEEIINANTHS
ncbi:hypothetical protein KDK77_09035 [bacterium]|nr:hypothetical protein [bacterium]MCP5463125.1 hypothetical protein [bacterium]